MKRTTMLAALWLCSAASVLADPGDDAAAYLRRIAALDDAGPALNAVIVTNPDAPEQARAADAAMLLLGGRTVLVKDNIETREWPTTAGSLALAGNRTGRDAPLIAALRRAGGVVLGKTNLSEWANIRDNHSTSGWSATGGLTKNPHATDRNPCGSSSGSGAAVAAGLAWGAIGTETNGSITCPASVNGVVGFKPSVGVVSRTHVVPISISQDTAGPMTQTVADAALLLDAIASRDPADTATFAVPRDSYRSVLTHQVPLTGVRIGVMRKQVGDDPKLGGVFEQALTDLTRAGAVLVDVEYEAPDELWVASLPILLFELRTGMADYLATLPGKDMPRTLADVIAFNKAHAAAELRWFGQDLFEQAVAMTDGAAYQRLLATARRLTREEGIDRLLREHDVRFLIAPTTGPAWTSDLVSGDHFPGGVGAGYLAAIAGYPHLTVPMGAVERLPVGLSFIGGRGSDLAVLQAGAAYERVRTARLPVPRMERWQPD